MISEKLKNLSLLCIPIFIVHSLEEYFVGFYNINSFYRSFSNPQMAFLIIVVISFNLLMIISYILIQKNIGGLILPTLVGLVLIYELIHIYEAIKVGGYYPGLYTGIIFPFLGYLYWRELIRNYKLK